MTTIVLADDHAVVRAGLALLLGAERDLEVVAQAGDAAGAVRAVLGHKPDVLVLDLTLPDRSGLEVLADVPRVSPATRVVVLTMLEDPEFARRALAGGALGYVLKEAADAELVEAVRCAARDARYLDPGLGARIAATPPPAEDRLSPREVEVLRLIALGHTNPEIASEFVLSVRTVETHRAHIAQKLGTTTRAELVRHALERDLL